MAENAIDCFPLEPKQKQSKQVPSIIIDLATPVNIRNVKKDNALQET